MTVSKHVSPIWWVEEGRLAGMPMPWLDPMRRENLGGPIDAFEDEMQSLWDAGIRSVVSLLNLPSDKNVYESAGFRFLCVPIPNGGAPSCRTEIHLLHDFFLESPAALAVHCEAGLGRTGTVVAMLLLAQGAEISSAVSRVRAAQPSAIETAAQLKFLEDCADYFK